MRESKPLRAVALGSVLLTLLVLGAAVPAAAESGSVVVVKYTDIIKERSSFYYETTSPCGAPVIVSDVGFLELLKYHAVRDAYKKLRGNNGIPVTDFILSRIDETSKNYILYVTRGIEYDENVIFIFVRPDTPQSVIEQASSAAKEAMATYRYDKTYIVIADYLRGVPDDVIHGEMRTAFEDAVINWSKTMGVSFRAGGGYGAGLYTVALFPVGGIESLGMDKVMDLANYIYGQAGACLPLHILVVGVDNPNFFYPATGSAPAAQDGNNANHAPEISAPSSMNAQIPLIGLLAVVLGGATAIALLIVRPF